LDSSHLEPGDCISGDQLESTHPGLRGSRTTSFYHVGTLFVDHASQILHFTPHISEGAKEAVSAKQQFEFFASIVFIVQSRNIIQIMESFLLNSSKKHVYNKDNRLVFVALILTIKMA
jgi:hypothetical protein